MRACHNINYEYSVPNSAAAALVWTIIPYMGNFVGSSTGETVMIEWHYPGGSTAQICATPTNPCYTAPPCLTVTIDPMPYMNDPPNITVCAGEQVQVDFTGIGPGDYDFEWTVWNTNNPFGLPPSGSGDLDFIAIHDWFLDVPVGGTVSVHPFEGGCEGKPEVFAIAVLPHPEMDPPPDLTVCAGAPVSVVFSGPAGTTYTWENSNTAVGLVASGSGNINFSAAQVTQTETAVISVIPHKGDCEGLPVEFEITVNPGPMLDEPPDVTVCASEPVSVTFSGTPTGGTCPGYPETFTISVLPRPMVNPVASVTACAGAPVTVNFGGTTGAAFEWENSNPAIGLSVSGTGNLSFTAADVSGVQTATVTVTPVKDGCPGQPKTFFITIKPLPSMDAPPDWTACAETELNIGFTGTAGSIFNWTNSNPAIGLGLPARVTSRSRPRTGRQRRWPKSPSRPTSRAAPGSLIFSQSTSCPHR